MTLEWFVPDPHRLLITNVTFIPFIAELRLDGGFGTVRLVSLSQAVSLVRLFHQRNQGTRDCPAL